MTRNTQSWCLASGQTSAIVLGYNGERSEITVCGENPWFLRFLRNLSMCAASLCAASFLEINAHAIGLSEIGSLASSTTRCPKWISSMHSELENSLSTFERTRRTRIRLRRPNFPHFGHGAFRGWQDSRTVFTGVF